MTATIADATFQPVICLGCKGSFVLMGQPAKDEYEQKRGAYCPTCKSYQRCQRGLEQ